MKALFILARFELCLLLRSVMLLVAHKMLTGGINMAGLRDDKATGGPSPGSVRSPVLAVMNAAITREADNGVIELPTSRTRAQAAGDQATGGCFEGGHQQGRRNRDFPIGPCSVGPGDELGLKLVYPLVGFEQRS